MRPVLLLVILAIFFFLIFVFFTASAPIEEDAFISFRYVQNLLRGQGLSFNPGDREEAYSNLAWILLLAIPNGMGVPLPLASWIASVLAAISLIVYLFRRVHPMAALLVASSIPFIHWAQHGLETVFYTMLITIGTIEAASASRMLRALGIASWMLAIMTRPEAPLLFAAVAFVRIILVAARRTTLREVIRYVSPVFLAFLGLEIFRWMYHGYLLPNPFYAKPPARSFSLGIFYIVELVTRACLWFVPASIVAWIIASRRVDPRLVDATVVVLAQCAFIVLEGGDQASKPLFRFGIPMLPLLFCIVTWCVLRVVDRWITSLSLRRCTIFVVAITFCFLQVFGHTERFPHHNFRDKTYSLLRASWRIATKDDRNFFAMRAFFTDPAFCATNFHTETARWIREHVAPGSLIAHDQMGQTPYYAGFDYRFLDLFGLSTRAVAKIRYEEGGYDNKAYRDYVFGRRPDYIMAYAFGHLEALGFSKRDPVARRADHPGIAEYSFHTLIIAPTGGQTWVFIRNDLRGE